MTAVVYGNVPIAIEHVFVDYHIIFKFFTNRFLNYGVYNIAAQRESS